MHRLFWSILGTILLCTATASAESRIDLSEEWAVAPDVTPLSGTWDFYFQEFLQPARPAQIDPGAVHRSLTVPAGWNHNDLPRYGYGTYRLHVTLPKTEAIVGLWIKQISASGRMYWNGRQVYSAGSPGTTARTETPGWRPQVVILPGVQEDNELIVHVSNFRDVAPGITSPILIGPIEDLFARQQRSIAGSVFLTGVMAIMAIFHLFLFLLRRKTKATLWFALFLADVAVRSTVVDELPLLQVWNTVSYTLILRLSYLTYPLAALFVLRFVATLLPDDTWAPGARLGEILSGVMAVIVVVTPVKFFISVAQYYHIAAVVTAVVIAITIVRALKNKRDSAELFAGGIFVLTLAAVHDILRALSIVTTPMLVPLATLVFVLLESVVLSRQHVLALRRAEEFSENLITVNQAVTRFLPAEMLQLIGVPDVTQISLGHVVEHDMSVLFVDIRGFTRLSERLGPKKSYTFVNEFLGTMGPIVREEGGVIDKYLGDGFFALFPNGGKDAVSAGHRLRRAKTEFNQRFTGEIGEDLEFGVGIHSGSLMLGTIGESKRMDTSAISDTVNLASRIESLTKYFHVGLAISAATYRQLDDSQHENSRFLGKLPIRGKAESVSVFEMFGGENPEIVRQKAETTQQFERGVISYFLEDFDDAIIAFQNVLTSYPEDRASARYLRLAEQQVPPAIGILAEV